MIDQEIEIGKIFGRPSHIHRTPPFEVAGKGQTLVYADVPYALFARILQRRVGQFLVVQSPALFAFGPGYAAPAESFVAAGS